VVPEAIGLLASWGVGRYGLDPVAQILERRLGRTLERASRLLAGRPYAAPERTAWGVFEACRVTDSEIVADYLGGVLAASSADDDGVPIASLIGRLASLDLRVHYLLYREVHRFIAFPEPEPGEDSRPGHLFIPLAPLLQALGSTVPSPTQDRFEGALRNLAREDLIGQAFDNSWGGLPLDRFVISSPDAPSAWMQGFAHPEATGVVMTPSAMGMTLMAWGCGAELPPSPRAFEAMTMPELSENVLSVDGTVRVNDLERLSRFPPA
jgi:hypothetical protein